MAYMRNKFGYGMNGEVDNYLHIFLNKCHIIYSWNLYYWGECLEYMNMMNVRVYMRGVDEGVG